MSQTESYKVIQPPQLSMPEKLNLSFRKAQSVKFRKTVSTRPNNLTAYWPMDEGTGVKVVDVVGANDGSLVGGASCLMENLVKPSILTGKQALFPHKQRVPNLELMARNPGPSASGLL